MWQKTVFVGETYVKYYNNLAVALSAIDNLSFAESGRKGGLTVCLAAEDDFSCEVSKRVDRALAGFMLESMKFDYIRRQTGFVAKTPSEAAVVAAMLYFDTASEPEAVLKKIKGLDRVSVDGVFNFLLFDLKETWKEIVSLSKNILSVSADSGDLLSVAGFISASGDGDGASLLIYAIGEKLCLKNLTLKKDVPVAELYRDAELDLVSAVVKQHPNRVILQCQNLSSAAERAIKSLAATKKADG